MALVHFADALLGGDAPKWTHFELARLRHLAGETHLAAESLDQLLDELPSDLTSEHLCSLLPVAHTVFQHVPVVASRLYALAVNHHCADYLAALRVAEAEERAGQLEQAAARVESLHDQLDDWGQAARARIAARLGHTDKACDIFERVCRGPNGLALLEQYAEAVLRPTAATKRVETFFDIATAAGATPSQIMLLKLRGATAQRDASVALDLLRALVDEGGTPSKWCLIDLLYLLLEARNSEGHGFVADRLREHFGEDRDALEALLNRAMATTEWETAEHLLDLLSDQIDARRSWIIILKRFELACFQGNLDAAASFLAQLGPIDAVPADAIPSIYRFLAECGDWDRLLDDARHRLSQGFAFNLLGDLVVRAARRTGRRAELLAWVEDVADWRSAPDLLRLYSVIGFDCLVADGNLDDRPRLLRLLQAIADEEEMARLDAFFPTQCTTGLSVTSARSPASPTAVFYCTNSRYLLGTAVALGSMFANNPALVDRIDTIVCADAACLRHARRVLTPIARRFGAKIIYLDAGSVCTAASLRSDYGLFTGGHSLAIEAYWRLYVARWLCARGRYARAIYLDSDLLIGPRFFEMLKLDLPEGACLMARTEVDREEVRAATLRHGLKPGSYFNSGVLVLDLSAPEAKHRIDAAIAIAENEADRLVLQDQCALNVAFAGVSVPLNERFNRFVAAGSSEEGLRSEYASSGVLHFLDRPKPWDPLYRGHAGRLWLEHWRTLSPLVPEAALRSAVADAIG